MRNPLRKRLPKELKSEFGKYLVLFLFITGMIAIVSGMLVASGSMHTAYIESFEKYNIEDGNFEYAQKAEPSQIAAIEKDGVTLYENFYVEEETDEVDSKLRIFKNRDEVNKVCVMEGELPDTNQEIAIDRMYADNNKITVGDKLSVAGEQLKVTGLVALSDYSALFASTSDMMFDAVKFGVAVMTEEGMAQFGDNHMHYSYSWQYEDAPANDEEAKKRSEEFLETLTANGMVTNYIPAFSNQAIQFAGDDIGKDKIIMAYFLYIVVIIIAFIFAITTSNTIVKEANVIGTLRASGYTKGELIRHYLAMPVMITLVSAILGNILGYTWFKDVAADMYYGSYSLPTYVTIWNANAFVQTTVIPVLLMITINVVILVDKLSLSPLQFIRRDVSRKKKKKAFRLNTKIRIMKRFRLRIVFQNMPNYITIVIGIFLANIILLFGTAIPSVLDRNQEDIIGNMICDYQYILKMPAETKTNGAEKYCATALNTVEGKRNSEEVSVYGIVDDSEYIDVDIQEGNVYISSAYAQKFEIAKGDKITLKETYGDKKYQFKVGGIYEYPAGIAVFMTQDDFCETFAMEEGYFNGYFSNEVIDDIEESYIATKITEDDMTKMSRQMKVSMGSMLDMFYAFGILMFMLIIYLLSKIIVEKNAQSISMTKILGYTNGEISGLYIMTTSLVVVLSLVTTLPLVSVLMTEVFESMLAQYSGWIPCDIPLVNYVKIAGTGMAAYAVIAFMQYKRVQKIPLDVALKNVE